MTDQNDKLRRLREHLQKAEWWPTTGIVEVIDSLLAEDQLTDDRDDEVMAELRALRKLRDATIEMRKCRIQGDWANEAIAKRWWLEALREVQRHGGNDG